MTADTSVCDSNFLPSEPFQAFDSLVDADPLLNEFTLSPWHDLDDTENAGQTAVSDITFPSLENFESSEINGIPAFSMQTSLTSSECTSDDLYNEDIGFLSCDVAVTEAAHDSILQKATTFLQETHSELDDDYSDILYEDTMSDDVIPSVTSSPECSPVLNRRQLRTGINTSQPWTRLSSSERMSVVQDLTELINCQLGLRERLDILHVLNPGSTDTHCVIDLESLNDDKLQAVRNYIKKHQHSQSESSLRSCDVSSSECGSSVNTPMKSSSKKRVSRSSRDSHQLGKLRRQELREKRSGLFRQEEVVSLTTATPEQCAEVDILT